MDAGLMFAPLSADEVAAAQQSTPKAGTKTPIIPVPADAPPMAFKHPKLGAPSRSWPYCDANGELVGYVCRWDFVGADGEPGKEILPVTYCEFGNGKRGWRSKGIPAPRPLFALPEIIANPTAWVLITEGEKTRDAAHDLFPDMVATTPAHGAKSPHLTDFSPLAGRTVVIATDYDEPGRTTDKGKPLHPGRDFGDKVCELVRAAGVASVMHLAPERLGDWQWRDGAKVARSVPLKDGWDLADAADEGWTADALTEMRKDPAFLAPYLDAAERGEHGDEDDDTTPGMFRSWPHGVEKRVDHTDKETGAITTEWKWFCSQLDIAAETRSSEGEEWGRLLTVRDRDGRRKQWAMPMALLAGDGTAYRERLLSLGLIMAPGKFARDALHEYISTARPDEKARCVGRVGWHGKSFILSNQTVDPTNG